MVYASLPWVWTISTCGASSPSAAANVPSNTMPSTVCRELFLMNTSPTRVYPFSSAATTDSGLDSPCPPVFSVCSVVGPSGVSAGAGEGVSSAFRGVSACVTCVSAASSIGDCRSTVSTGSGSESAAHRSPSSHCTSRCASELSRTACAAARRSWLPAHTAASHSTSAPHTAAAPRRHFTSPTAFQTSLCPDKQKNTRHNFL